MILNSEYFNSMFTSFACSKSKMPSHHSHAMFFPFFCLFENTWTNFFTKAFFIAKLFKMHKARQNLAYHLVDEETKLKFLPSFFIQFFPLNQLTFHTLFGSKMTNYWWKKRRWRFLIVIPFLHSTLCVVITWWDTPSHTYLLHSMNYFCALNAKSLHLVPCDLSLSLKQF